jgi:hypothetical protein
MKGPAQSITAGGSDRDVHLVGGPRTIRAFRELGALDRLELVILLCVPKTSSTSCDQAVLVDQTGGVSLPPDAVPVEIDRFG